jgi:hypothetical protein
MQDLQGNVRLVTEVLWQIQLSLAGTEPNYIFDTAMVAYILLLSESGLVMKLRM